MSRYIKPPRPEDCHWRRDKPPAPGWYPAGFSKNPDFLRWWNGSHWSLYGAFASCMTTRDVVGIHERVITRPKEPFYWCEPWWPTKNGKA